MRSLFVSLKPFFILCSSTKPGDQRTSNSSLLGHIGRFRLGVGNRCPTFGSSRIVGTLVRLAPNMGDKDLGFPRFLSSLSGFDWVERFLEPDPKKHEAPELLLSLFIGPIHTYAHRRFSTP